MRHNLRKLWGVVLVLCLLLPTATGAAAIGPEQIGARAALADGNLTLTKMLTYALGRHVDYRDMPAIRKIVRSAAPGGYRWSTIILGVVTSTPFQMGSTAS